MAVSTSVLHITLVPAEAVLRFCWRWGFYITKRNFPVTQFPWTMVTAIFSKMAHSNQIDSLDLNYSIDYHYMDNYLFPIQMIVWTQMNLTIISTKGTFVRSWNLRTCGASWETVTQGETVLYPDRVLCYGMVWNNSTVCTLFTDKVTVFVLSVIHQFACDLLTLGPLSSYSFALLWMLTLHIDIQVSVWIGPTNSRCCQILFWMSAVPMMSLSLLCYNFLYIHP